MSLFLEITYKDRSIKVFALQDDHKDYVTWGITAVGCVFTTREGEYMIIHPKSVLQMRQYRK